jgi:uncharacterized protein
MAKDAAKAGAAGKQARPCPICGKPAIASAKPFCSDRCRDVDLNRWLSARYIIPARDEEDDAE